ncbi:hypothetical protein [Sphaerisporangium dianthi]|uniref:Uncharacterized protein n=1 Tax=Sphaerisporangium dianthi TaxID=1436120 RepID=A0ABV9CVG9_9ACTN
MIAVIFGLVAVVLLVLVVVALGMRSMNRRESNLPPERLEKLAKQAEDPSAKRPGRPAEETFFESFPEGFDAFQEPERATARLRPGGGKPGARPAGRPGGRPAPRGKQHAARGRRGVDEWGDADDYDDDYWTRVRADDGAFGGTIAARVGASRPDLASPGSSAVKPPAPKEKDEADPNAATVQAPLPTRSPGLSGLVEPARNGAPSSPAAAGSTDRTVTFSAPVPGQSSPASPPPAAASAADVLGAIGASQAPSRNRRGSRPDPADPLGITDAGRAKPRRRPEPGAGDPGRSAAPGRPADPRRRTSAGRPADTGRAASGRPEPARVDPLATGPLAGAHPTGALANDPLSSGPLSGGAASRDPLTSRDPLSSRDPLTSGSPLAGRAPSGGAVSGAATSRGPLPGGPASSGSRQAGPASSGPRPAGPLEGSRAPRGAFDAGRSSTGSHETPPAAGGPRGTGSFPGGSFGAAGSAGSGSANSPTGEFPASPPAAAQSPAAQSWPARPAYPATGSYDILDEPTPPSGSSNETWKASDYQLPAYDGYAPAPSAPGTSSYEVRPGWAVIDDSDTVNGPTPPAGMPAGSARGPQGYDAQAARPSRSEDTLPGAGGQGQGYGGGGHEPDRASGATSSSWAPPRQNTGGSWPSYGELYGNGVNNPDDPTVQSSNATPSRGGHRRPADTDYPDYYR